MNILVTGAAGFIGSNFARLALARRFPHKIVVFDKFTYAGRMENLEGLNLPFVKGDIASASDVEKALEEHEIDAMINFAAETHVDNSIKGDDEFMHSNIIGIQNLLKLSLKHGVKRFMQISTDEVYGSIEKGSFTENYKLNPRNPYSASKAAGEMLVNAYIHTFGLNAVITRTCNNYGPFQHKEKFIPHCIELVKKGRKVSIYGNGMQVRDWIHVEDNCDALMLLFEKGARGEVYNISAECEMTNVEMAKKILKVLGRNENEIEFVEDRKGHDFRYSIECSKLKKLGWRPKIKIGDGLKSTIDWYSKNKWVFS